MKRLIDLTLGTLLALLATPLIMLLAACAVISFRCTPFFVQQRVGRYGQPLTMVKVRSLPRSAPADADKRELKTVSTSRFGRRIRGSHLDELPQLWSVVTGSMSLVGPRPEMQHMLDRFTDDHRETRALHRPGCTGLWQISTASGGMIYEAPEYDLFYARHASVRLDLWVMWRTARLLTGGRGVTLDDVPGWAVSRTHAGIASSSAELNDEVPSDR